jgi:hypothetical protein
MQLRPAFRTAQESWPKQGNRELTVNLNFTASGTVFDDLGPEMQASQIDFIQSVYIDNSQNNAPLTLTFLDTNINITAQPLTQGLYPVFAQGLVRYKAVTSPGIVIPICFSNTPKDHFVWGPTPGVTVVPALVNPPINFQPLAAGDNVLVNGLANTTIKLYRSLLTFGAGTNVQFFSGPSANNNPLTGIINMFAGGAITFQPSGIPWLTTRTADNLVMNSSNAVNMGGVIGYAQN